jgi:hypothetical protein
MNNIKYLTQEDRSILREFLNDRFSLDELKDLAFDMGLATDKLPSNTINEFVREFISFCERTNQINCLLENVMRQRPAYEIANIVGRYGSCAPRAKVILIFDANVIPGSPDHLRALLADVLNLSVEQVSLLAAKIGSIHLLIGIPESSISKLLSGIKKLRLPVYSDTNLKIRYINYLALSHIEKENWRFRACSPNPLNIDKGGFDMRLLK